MKVVKWIIIVLVAIAALFLIIAAFIPKEYEVIRDNKDGLLELTQ